MWYAEDTNLSSLNSKTSFLAPNVKLACPKVYFLEHSNYKFLLLKKASKSKNSKVKSFRKTLHTISPSCYFIMHKCLLTY